MKALIISADHFEDTELLYPYYRLQEAGLEVDVASVSRGRIHGKHGYEVAVSTALRDVDPNAYDLLVLPGGKAPASLRKEPAAVGIARDFMHRNKPVAAICHGPQIRSRQACCRDGVPPATTRWPKNCRQQALSTKTGKWWWTACWSHPGNLPTCPPSCAKHSGCWANQQADHAALEHRF
jgi:DJ-1/PfpI family